MLYKVFVDMCHYYAFVMAEKMFTLVPHPFDSGHICSINFATDIEEARFRTPKKPVHLWKPSAPNRSNRLA